MLEQAFFLPSFLLGQFSSSGADLTEWRAQTSILYDILVFIWILNVLNWTFLGNSLSWFSTKRRRTPVGLVGIFISPLLHGNLAHLLSNSLAFFVLGWMILTRNVPGANTVADFIMVTIIVALAEGIGVWFFGRSENHTGGSGVIFGYFGFLLLSSLFEINNPSILLLTLVVGILYWRLLPNVIPNQKQISWEGHLFGFLAGILTAQFLPILRALVVPG
ncbi:MAG: rhomboid family intramembrane serine protease [Oculatellaceae cyanobacterium Prado106]|nr:rhomboid family intramembrane serine protease [Oculatellaceae cyanobacterium Prado106]